MSPYRRFYPDKPPPQGDLHDKVGPDLNVSLLTLTTADIVQILSKFDPDQEFAALIVTGKRVQEVAAPATSPPPTVVPTAAAWTRLRASAAPPSGAVFGDPGSPLSSQEAFLRIGDGGIGSDVLVSLTISPTRGGND